VLAVLWQLQRAWQRQPPGAGHGIRENFSHSCTQARELTSNPSDGGGQRACDLSLQLAELVAGMTQDQAAGCNLPRDSSALPLDMAAIDQMLDQDTWRGGFTDMKHTERGHVNLHNGESFTGLGNQDLGSWPSTGGMGKPSHSDACFRGAGNTLIGDTCTESGLISSFQPSPLYSSDLAVQSSHGSTQTADFCEATPVPTVNGQDLQSRNVSFGETTYNTIPLRDEPFDDLFASFGSGTEANTEGSENGSGHALLDGLDDPLLQVVTGSFSENLDEGLLARPFSLSNLLQEAGEDLSPKSSKTGGFPLGILDMSPDRVLPQGGQKVLLVVKGMASIDMGSVCLGINIGGQLILPDNIQDGAISFTVPELQPGSTLLALVDIMQEPWQQLCDDVSMQVGIPPVGNVYLRNGMGCTEDRMEQLQLIKALLHRGSSSDLSILT